MENLSNITELSKKGKYKFVGIMLQSDPVLAEEKKTLGVCLVFLKNVENDSFHFIENSKLFGSNPTTPYGSFQKHISRWNSNFSAELKEDEDGVKRWNIWDSEAKNTMQVGHEDNEEQAMIKDGKKH